MKPDTYVTALRRNPSARELIVALEARGFRLRVHRDRVQARPADQLTAADRRQLRQHHADVAVLVEHRDSWSDWHAKPLPVFDPSKAFFTDAEIRGVAS